MSRPARVRGTKTLTDPTAGRPRVCCWCGGPANSSNPAATACRACVALDKMFTPPRRTS